MCAGEYRKDWKEIFQNQGAVAVFCFNFIPSYFPNFLSWPHCFYNQKISSKLKANSFFNFLMYLFLQALFPSGFGDQQVWNSNEIPIPAGLCISPWPWRKSFPHPCWQPAVHSCSEKAADEWSWWENTTFLTLQGWHYTWNSCSPKK